MAENRLTQSALEVLDLLPPVTMRVTQVAMEALDQLPHAPLRVTQVVLEVLDVQVGGLGGVIVGGAIFPASL
jgi:hypothetical protein